MQNVIRWGIMAPGSIAHPFVEGLITLKEAKVVAVGSRNLNRAHSFCHQYKIPRAYGSYEELASDPEIDIIYVATPHPFHKDCVKLCLNAGKAVLCEKPFTLNARDSLELAELAREKKLFLMEAMWTRFLPAMAKVRSWLKQGVIGEIRSMKADIGYRSEFDPESRLFDPSLGGGALLDIGIYAVSLASMVFGKQPDTIKSVVEMAPTGVDEQSGILFGYDKGRFASISTAIRTTFVNDAVIYGTEGYIHIPDFYHAQQAILYPKDGRKEAFGPMFTSTGYQYEALEVMSCLHEDRLESNVMPLDETVAIMAVSYTHL
ncbi:MAG: Gfo/Idh/MocA family oxidoreductase, partial [Clostridia bacterium]|nr:Gfo/Idh/MocA family oxidoreductase [Clostridia bacterium]